MPESEKRKLTLAEFIQEHLDKPNDLSLPLFVSIDQASAYNHDATVITLMGMKPGLSGKLPTMVIIDEVRPLIGEDLQKILDIYSSSSKPAEEHQGKFHFRGPDGTILALKDNPTLVKKGNRMVKRHHPVPETPRRPGRR